MVKLLKLNSDNLCAYNVTPVLRGEELSAASARCGLSEAGRPELLQLHSVNRDVHHPSSVHSSSKTATANTAKNVCVYIKDTLNTRYSGSFLESSFCLEQCFYFCCPESPSHNQAAVETQPHKTNMDTECVAKHI